MNKIWLLNIEYISFEITIITTKKIKICLQCRWNWSKYGLVCCIFWPAFGYCVFQTLVGNLFFAFLQVFAWFWGKTDVKWGKNEHFLISISNTGPAPKKNGKNLPIDTTSFKLLVKNLLWSFWKLYGKN